MLAKRIIPCLDIKDGKTVKGVNFENLIYTVYGERARRIGKEGLRIGEQRRGLFGQRKSKDRVKTGGGLFCRRIIFGFPEDVVKKGAKIDHKQDVRDQYGKLVARIIGKDGS